MENVRKSWINPGYIALISVYFDVFFGSSKPRDAALTGILAKICKILAKKS